MKSSTRNALIVAALALGAAYLLHRNDSFWGIVMMVLVAIMALIYALPLLDGGWRMRAGFAICTFLTCGLLLWPTAEQAGWVKCPPYFRDRINVQLTRGLDLSGGARFVYSVEVEDAIRDKRNRLADDMRKELATIYGFHSGDTTVKREELKKLEDKVHVAAPPAESAVIRMKFTDPADTAKIDERFMTKFQRDLSQGKGPTPNDVIFHIRTEVETTTRERAVAQAKETVNKRVDELGLREASVTTRDEDIIVEVPGENEKAFEDIKEIIRRTARLEFKMVDDEMDFFGRYKEDELPVGEGIRLEPENAPTGIDGGQKKSNRITYARMNKRPEETMTDCRERFKKWVATLPVPDDHQIGYEPILTYDTEAHSTAEEGWRTFYLFARTEVGGDNINDAQVSQEQEGQGGYAVSLSFTQAGSDRFEEVTGANINRRFAIILDDVIDSAPVIRTKIGGGRASISMGAGDPEEQLSRARKLELVLRSGALPAPISLSSDSKIGPTLGRDAIKQGVTGMLVGSGLVLVGMLIYYRKSGVVADLAVLFNMMIQLSALAANGATMTLPGIAGLALTIGMSVDANVLINERIREELRTGKTIRAAVEAGYDRAFSSILDGHVTVLITALILWQFGSGPVKGFAITLFIGIVASLFTGVFCTRIVFDYWVRGSKLKRLSVGAEF